MLVLSSFKKVQAQNLCINDYVRYWPEPATDGGLPFMVYDIRTPVTDHPKIYDRVLYWIERSAAETGFRPISKNDFLNSESPGHKPRVAGIVGFAMRILHKKIKSDLLD